MRHLKRSYMLSLTNIYQFYFFLLQLYSLLTIITRFTSGRAGGPQKTTLLDPHGYVGMQTEKVQWRPCYSIAKVKGLRWCGLEGYTVGL